MRRRAYLGLVGTAGIAGCLGGDSDSDGEQSDDGQETTDGGSAEQENGEDGLPSFDSQWRVSLDTTIANAVNMDPATADGRLYLGGDWGLTAVEVTEGEKLWTDDDRAEFVEVEAHQDTVAAVTHGGELLSLDPAGGVNWAQEVPEGSAAPSIALTGDRLALAERDGVTVYDAASGTEEWTAAGAGAVYATSDTLIFARGFEPTTGHDPRSGQQQWEADASARLGGKVAPGDDLLVGIERTRLESVNAVETTSGDLRWSVDEVTLSPFASVGVGEGVAAFIDESGEEKTLVGVSLSDGSVAWEQSLGNPPVPLQPLVGAGAVITETDEGVAAFDPETGEQYDATDDSVVVGAIEAGHFLSCRTEVVGYEL